MYTYIYLWKESLLDGKHFRNTQRLILIHSFFIRPFEGVFVHSEQAPNPWQTGESGSLWWALSLSRKSGEFWIAFQEFRFNWSEWFSLLLISLYEAVVEVFECDEYYTRCRLLLARLLRWEVVKIVESVSSLVRMQNGNEAAVTRVTEITV